MDVAIAIEGLSDFRRALRRVSDDLPKLLKEQLKAAAEQAATRAHSRYVAQYSRSSGKRGASGASKHTADTIRATATQSGSGLLFGGARYPWVPGQEFGSDRFKQFAPYTGVGPGGRGSMGRVIFPAVRDEAEGTERTLLAGFNDLARHAYPEP